MKRQSNTPFAQISSEDLRNLITIVKETVATCTNINSEKTFTAAELWNIQRQKKSLYKRRFSF